MIIKEFQGDHRWLSNFAPCTCYLWGVRFYYTENAYQASKLDPNTQWHQIQDFSCEDMHPGAAKKLIRKLAPPHTDRQFSLEIMRDLNLQKYHKHMNPTLHDKLKATGEAELIEGNYWGDKYWGVCLKTNVGENMLGKIIMSIRDIL